MSDKKKNNPLIDIEHDHYTYEITYDHGPEYYIGSRTKKPGEILYDYMGSSFAWENFMEQKGIENFTKVIISDFPTREEANQFENEKIDLDDPFCMNIGKHPGKFNTAGTKWVHNPKTGKHKRIPKNLEIPEGWVEGVSEEYKKRLGEIHKDIPKSEEHKRKMSETRKGSGRDYVVTSPQNVSFLVTSPKLWAQEHFPDNWRYVNIAIGDTAAGRQKTFLNGWIARYAENSIKSKS